MLWLYLKFRPPVVAYQSPRTFYHINSEKETSNPFHCSLLHPSSRLDLVVYPGPLFPSSYPLLQLLSYSRPCSLPQHPKQAVFYCWKRQLAREERIRILGCWDASACFLSRRFSFACLDLSAFCLERLEVAKNHRRWNYLWTMELLVAD